MHCLNNILYNVSLINDSLPNANAEVYPLPEYGSGAQELPPWPVVTVGDPALTPSCPLRVTSAHRPD